MSYNQKAHLALCFQNSFGTANVSSLHHMQYLEESIGLDIPPLVDGSNNGTFDEGESYEGAKVIGGDLSVNAKSIPLGVLLRALMGPASVATPSSSYVHLFKPRTADFDKYSAGDPITVLKHMDDGGSASLFSDMNVSMIEFGASNGEFLTAKATFVGGTFAQNVDIAPSYEAGKRFTWDSSSIQLDGAANADLKALTIKIDDKLEATHTLNGSKYPSRVKRTDDRAIDVSGTLVFDDQVEYQKFLVSSMQAMNVAFAGPLNVGSGGPDLIEFDIPAFRYIDFKPVSAGKGKMEVGFTGVAKYHTSSATAIAITLTNTFAVY